MEDQDDWVVCYYRTLDLRSKIPKEITECRVAYKRRHAEIFWVE